MPVFPQTYLPSLEVIGNGRFKGPGPWVDVMSGAFTRKCSASIQTTTLGAGASGGATTLTLTSALDFATGHGLYVVLDNGTVHFTYITAGGGTTSVTINDALPSAAASGKAVGHDDTLAFQDATDFGGANTTVYVPAGTYRVRQIKLYSAQCLRGAGGKSTTIASPPGNTATAMVILQAITTFGVCIRDLLISGNKSAAQTPSCGAILLDNTGGGTVVDHYIIDVLIANQVGDGVSLKSVVQSKVRGLMIESCNGHGFKTDSLCFDNSFSDIRITQAGLHGFLQGGSGDLIVAHVGSSGQVDATTYGDNINVTGRANKIVAWVGHALRDGIRLDGAGNNYVEVMIHSNTNYHVSLVNSAYNNRLKAQMGYNNTEQALAVLNLASGTQNDIDITYYTGSLAAGNPPAIGAALSGSDNYISMRHGSKNGSGDINVFECEPLFVTQDWTRTSPTTLWCYPGGVVYHLP